jgi:hypothetical protein
VSTSADSYHSLVELIARMKSNLGNSQEWAKQLEEILGIEQVSYEYRSGSADA